MRRAGLVAAWLAALAGGAGAQDDSLVRGQRYLDSIGKQWAEKQPVERLLGLYIGRRWVGYARFSVRAAAPESGAAFEVTTRGEIVFMGKTMKSEARAFLDANLAVRRAESSLDTAGVKSTRTLKVEGTKWNRAKNEGGKVALAGGEVRTGTTWDGSQLPLFGRPGDDEVCVISLTSDGEIQKLKKLGPPQKRSVAGREIECSVLEMRAGKEAPDRWYFAPDGSLVEVASGAMPVRMRPIEEAELGRDLSEPLSLGEPLRALIESFVARKKNDRDAFLRGVDVETFIRRQMPEFGDVPPEEKKKVVDAMKRRLCDELMSPSLREALPEPDMMADFLAAAATVAERDGGAEIWIMGRQGWRLARAAEGERRGRWVIVGYEDRR